MADSQLEAAKKLLTSGEPGSPPPQLVVLPAAMRNGNGDGGRVDIEGRDSLSLQLGVTAAFGADPTLNVRIETRNDEDTEWVNAGAYRRVTKDEASDDDGNHKTHIQTKTFSGLKHAVRAVHEISGNGASFPCFVAEKVRSE